MKAYKIIYIIFLLFFTGCGGEADAPEKDSNEIYIHDDRFVPAEIEITPGTEIVWINKSSTIQTVTSGIPEDILFDSGEISPGESFSFVFNNAGPVQYYSKNDPEKLRGMITVIPEEVVQ